MFYCVCQQTKGHKMKKVILSIYFKPEDEKLLNKLAALAAKNMRSVSAQALYLIQKAIENEKQI
jgi:uncharacterized lipoprotein YehR (DUF1307 family)